MAGDYSVKINLLLNGMDQLRQLGAAINDLGRAAQGVGTKASKPLEEAAEAAEEAAKKTKGFTGAEKDAEKAILAHAQALARLRVAQGDTAGAVKALETALSQVNRETTAGIRAQTQLVGIKAQVSTAAGKAETQLLREAQAAARLAQISGDTARAQTILRDALAKVSNKGSLAALRAELQLTYLNTNYQNSPLIGAIRGLGAGLGQILPLIGRVNPQMAALLSQGAGAAGAMQGIGAAAGGALPAVLAIGAALVGIGGAAVVVGKAVDALRALGEQGIRVNAELENLQIGIATVLASVGKLSDSKGVELKGIDALKAALPLAAEDLRRLQVAGLETSLTFRELGQGFLQAIGPGLAGGLKRSEILDTVISLSQLIKPLTGNTAQLGQELRALLSGEINARSSQVATTLGITADEIKRAKQEAGGLAKLLQEKLAVAQSAGLLVGKTFDAAVSNLQEAYDVLSRVVTTGLFNSIRDSLNNVLPNVFDKTSEDLISSKFRGIADVLTRIFDTVGIAAGKVIAFLAEKVEAVSAFLSENKETIFEIVALGEEMVRQVVEYWGQLAAVLGLTSGWKDRVEGVKGLLQVVLGVMITLKGATLAVLSTIGFFGNAIKAAMIKPFAAALEIWASMLELIGKVDLTGQFKAFGAAARAMANSAKSIQSEYAAARDAAAGAVTANIKGIRDGFKEAEARIKGAEDRLKAFRANQKKDTSPPGLLGTRDKDKEEEAKAAAAAAAKEAKLREEAAETIRKAEQRLKEALAAQSLALARLAAEEEARVLETQLQDQKISLEAYYSAKARLTSESTARELADIRRRIATEKEELVIVAQQTDAAVREGKTAGEKEKLKAEGRAKTAQITSEIIALETRLKEVEAQGAVESARNIAAKQEALRQLQAEIGGLNLQLLQATGRSFEAAAVEIGARFKTVLARAILEFGEDSPEVGAVRSLQGALLNQAALQEFEARRRLIETQLRNEIGRIQTQVSLGLKGEATARREILEIEREKRRELEEQIKAQIALTRATLAPGVERDQRLADLQGQLEGLRASGIDPIFADIRQGLTRDLAGAAQEFLTGFTDGLEALRRLAVSVLTAIRDAIARRLMEIIERVVIDPFVDRILGFLFGKQIKAQDDALRSKVEQVGADIKGAVASVDASQRPFFAETKNQLEEIIALLRERQQAEPGGRPAQLETLGAGVGIGSLILGAITGGRQGEKTGLTIRGEDGEIIPGGEETTGILEKVFGKVTNIFQGFGKTLGGIVEKIGGLFGNIGSAIFDGIAAAVGFIFKALSGGFSTGGYTGDAGKAQPVGVVHGQEFVEPAHVVKRWGAGFFEAIRTGRIMPADVIRGLGGRLAGAVTPRFGAFEAGGLVGVAAGLQPAAAGAGSPSALGLRIINVHDESRMAGYLSSPAGEKSILNVISRYDSQIKARLGLKG